MDNSADQISAEQSALPIAHPESIWKDFAMAYPAIGMEDAVLVWDAFAPEMSIYTELVTGPQGSPAGMMVRGQGQEFTEKAAGLMRKWAFSEEDVAHFLELADLYAHTNAFLKIEWHPEGERLVSAYFRRRPPVRRVLHQLHGKGTAPEVLKNILWISKVLQKDNVHFVSASYRPGKPMRHKLYFSQALKPDTWAKIVQRVLTLMAQLRTDLDARNQFIQIHPLLAPPDKSSTMFISFSFDQNGLHASFKLDYPEVAPETIVQAMGIMDAGPSDLCKRVNSNALTFLGLRFHPQKGSELKYYADLHGKA